MKHVLFVLKLLSVAALLAAAGTLGLAPFEASADEARPQAPIGFPTNIWAISRGGQLYDKWWEVIEAEEPKTTHPAYPAKGEKKGSATWRCKECHGWDYKGVDGAYGKGIAFHRHQGSARGGRHRPRKDSRDHYRQDPWLYGKNDAA